MDVFEIEPPTPRTFSTAMKDRFRDESMGMEYACMHCRRPLYLGIAPTSGDHSMVCGKCKSTPCDTCGRLWEEHLSMDRTCPR